MINLNKCFHICIALLFITMSVSSAQNYPAVFDFENILNTYFDDESGLISFDDARVIFAPDGKFKGQIAVLDSDNKILANFKFYEDYATKEGVYARIQVQTPADVTLSKPGIYTIVYLVDGKPATRLPVRLVQTAAGDDPFNPQKKYGFDGYWRTFALITMNTWKGEKFPEVFYWLGGIDLPEGKTRDSQMATLLRDGKVVAHSKRNVGIIQPGHFKEVKSSLYHVHAEGKEANAQPFLLKDWLVDGKYELRINRMSDMQALRSYDFKVSNGKIEEHPRSKLGYEPLTDFIAPRVQKKGVTYPELTEAIWIEDRKLD
jgi:hypothetical protein